MYKQKVSWSVDLFFNFYFIKASNVDWTFLSKTALKDDKIIQVETTVDWKVGDKIVIAGTDFSYIIDYRINLPSSVSYQRGR